MGRNQKNNNEMMQEIPGAFFDEDGVMRCVKCGAVRERTLLFFGEEMKISCSCKCIQEKQEREAENRKHVERLDRIRKYRSMGFRTDDEEIRNARLENDDGANPDVTAIVKAYLAHFEEMREKGLGILFYGPVGTGKSFFGGCLFNGVIDQCKPALITNFSRLINETNAIFGQKQNQLDKLGQYDLVVIDDLGVEKTSEWNNEQITLIVDTLYRVHVPLILTSNYTPNQLRDEKDINRKRIYDRILKNCRPVPVLGESRRKKLGKANTELMKDIIGV